MDVLGSNSPEIPGVIEAFGVPAKNVKEFTFSIKAGGLAVVSVHYEAMITCEELSQALNVLQEYSLVRGVLP